MNHVIEIPKESVDDLVKEVSQLGLPCSVTGYGVVFRSEKLVVTIYRTGKILFQGSDVDNTADKVVDLIRNRHGLSPAQQYSSDIAAHSTWPRIGTDESGKGDFFGPLVTAAFLVISREAESALADMGVRDCKLLNDRKVKELAGKIMAIGPYAIVRIGPKRYNELYGTLRNVNRLLAWSHARAIENVLSGNACNLIVSDQFGDPDLIKSALFERGKNIQLLQMHRAESDIAVAAASIIARHEFLASVEKLSRECGMQLPLGAGPKAIAVAKSLIRAKGVDSLEKYAKTHFKTFRDAMT